MPHVEIKYSDNLNINVDTMFDDVESIINEKMPALANVNQELILVLNINTHIYSLPYRY